MFATVVVVLLAVAATSTLGAHLGSLAVQRWSATWRRRLDDVVVSSPLHIDLLELADARDAFEAEVHRPAPVVPRLRTVPVAPAGSALESPLVVSTTGVAADGDDEDPALTAARQRFFAAKRRVDERIAANHQLVDPRRWVVYGAVRRWGFGLLGVERALLRIEHLDSEDWWAIIELRRRRFGVGIGWDRQQVAGRVDASRPRDVLVLLCLAFDDDDAGLRLGGWLRRRRRRHHRRATDEATMSLLLERATPANMVHGLVGQDRARLIALADDVEHGECEPTEPELRTALAGPSVVAGWWTGRRAPEIRLLSTSGQGSWFGI